MHEKKLPPVFYYDDSGNPVEVKWTDYFEFTDIGNYYGHLELYRVEDEGVAYYWGIADWDRTTGVEYIPLDLGNALVEYYEAKLKERGQTC